MLDMWKYLASLLWITPEQQDGTGYVAQEVALDKILTGRELLQLQAALYHLPSAVGRELTLYWLLSLEEWADKRIGTIRGLRKRLDLAAGLLHAPDVLVLDEPTVGLDIEPLCRICAR